MKCLSSLAWSGNKVISGGAIFDPNRTEENISEVMRNRQPAVDRGISPGDDGKFSSELSSVGCESVL
jgi:hypothetical protein